MMTITAVKLKICHHQLYHQWLQKRKRQKQKVLRKITKIRCSKQKERAAQCKTKHSMLCCKKKEHHAAK